MSRRKIVSAVFTGVAAAGVTAMAAPAAFAGGGQWIIKNNSGKSLTTSTQYSASNSTPATLTAGATVLSCPGAAASASGTFFPKSKTAGSGPVQIGTITKADFGTLAKSCTLGALAHFSARLAAGHTLKLNASGTTTSTGGATVVNGKVSGSILENLNGTIIGGGTCAASVSGTSIPASFNDGTHHLTLNPQNISTLHVKHTTCPGITSGENAKFHATYHLFAPASLSMGTITDP